MHTVIVPHLSTYSEYSRVEGGAWFFRRSVSLDAVCWC
jgi:hypothetical protein